MRVSGEPLVDSAEMDIARQHHAAGAHAPLRGVDPLAHPGGIDDERRRVLEEMDARPLGRIGKAQRVGQRVDMERARKMNGVEIVAGPEHVADPLDRPGLDLGADLLLQQADPRHHGGGILALGHVEPAFALHHIVHMVCRDGVAHILNTCLRQHPQAPWRPGTPIPLDDLLDPRRKTRQHEAGVAAGRVPCDAPRLHHRDRPAAPHHLARHRDAGNAGADHADIDVQIEVERRPRRRQRRHAGIPGRSEFGLQVVR